jgi:hypothetical protein
MTKNSSITMSNNGIFNESMGTIVRKFISFAPWLSVIVALHRTNMWAQF